MMLLEDDLLSVLFIHLSEYQLIRTRAESLTQSGWGRTVL